MHTAEATALDRNVLADWYRRNRSRSRMLFDLLTDDAYYSRPITLRHPIVFYEGHLPAFSFNTLVKKALGGKSIDPSLERKQILQSYGADIIYTDPADGSDGAIRVARELAAAHPEKYFYADQYSNDANWRAHYHGTAAEIIDAVGDRLTHFVAGVGTSGTIVGTSRRLHEHRPFGISPQ